MSDYEEVGPIFRERAQICTDAGAAPSQSEPVERILSCKQTKRKMGMGISCNTARNAVSIHDLDILDNSMIVYRTGTGPPIRLLVEAVRHAREKEAAAMELQFRGDQGSSCMSNAYFT